MQVGSLFNLKAFGLDEDENKQEKEKQAQARRERALKKEIIRQHRRQKYLAEHGFELTSESSESEEDAETAKVREYEELLKMRIFLSDRFEKIEKALLQM
jgi:acyl-CoA synthetase (NDP forming)